MQGSEARALGTKITHSSEHLTGLACHHKEVNPARVLLWEGRASGGSEVTEGTRPSSCLTSRPPGGRPHTLRCPTWRHLRPLSARARGQTPEGLGGVEPLAATHTVSGGGPGAPRGLDAGITHVSRIAVQAEVLEMLLRGDRAHATGQHS